MKTNGNPLKINSVFYYVISSISIPSNYIIIDHSTWQLVSDIGCLNKAFVGSTRARIF